MANVIETDGLGKRYVIGASMAQRSGLRELLASPLRALKGRGTSAGDNVHWALRDVSLRVGEGERIGLIGRNGAGKSTLLKLLARITHPTTGRIRIAGRVASLLEVGTGFHPELSGRENIYLNAALLGMSARDVARRFDAIVAFAEIGRYLDTAVKHYSSGMYMRLAFAVAAHVETDILLVDEVLAVGDANFQRKCLNAMGDAAAAGRTVVLVSHRMNAITSLCDRVVMLSEGSVVLDSRDVRHAVRQYLVRDDDALRGAWYAAADAPARDGVRLLAFYISDADGRPVEGVRANDDDSLINVEFELKSVDSALKLGYALYADSGELLYWSFCKDGPASDWPTLKRGRNVLSSALPKRLLNEGEYRLELIAGFHYRSWIAQPDHDAPSIVLEIQGGLSDSPLWLERRAGLLAPDLPWACREP
ncbi:MAG: ABC transporter ATP-binding protein [Gammaproteobacteria bacterium]|nr:ABC transporter ATP-binding protein [Gammaproteobacteria bacterium]